MASRTIRLEWVVLGFVAGAAIGYVMRPSAFLVGQLPFDAVITRGANLTGLDQLLVSTAQASFNVMLVGGLIGTLCGWGLSSVIPVTSTAAPATPREMTCRECGIAVVRTTSTCPGCGAPNPVAPGGVQ